MTILLAVFSAYVLFSFLRAIYGLSTGFLYTTPANSKAKSTTKPLVSVVIPAWNEEVGISRTVKSVINNGYRNVEVIIVDDGSIDNTSKIANALAKRYKRAMTISQPNGGKASALNTGIQHSTGSLVLTLDADSFLEYGSIKKMVAALQCNEYAVSIGEVIVGNTRTWIGRVQHFEYSIGFHAKRAQHVFKSAYIFPGALTMFRKSVLQSIGGFSSSSSTEDLDISMRIKMAGYKIAYVDSAICVTEGATTINGLINQRARWRHGYLECLLHYKEFLYSPQKGWYLTLIDLPIQLFRMIELLMLPIVLIATVYILSLSANIINLISALLLVPFVLVLLADTRSKFNEIRPSALAMPIMLITIELVEYIALLKSIYRVITRRQTQWTQWQRTGASA